MNKYVCVCVCVCVFESSKLTMCLVYRGGKKLKMCRQEVAVLVSVKNYCGYI